MLDVRDWLLGQESSISRRVGVNENGKEHECSYETRDRGNVKNIGLASEPIPSRGITSPVKHCVENATLMSQGTLASKKRRKHGTGCYGKQHPRNKECPSVMRLARDVFDESHRQQQRAARYRQKPLVEAPCNVNFGVN